MRATYEQEWQEATDFEETRTYSQRFLNALAGLDLERAAVSGGLLIDEADLIRDSMLSPSIHDALGRVGTELPNGALHIFSDAQMMGWTNLIQGTVFEQAVTDAANHGQIALPLGADHVELAGRTQEAWDLNLMRGQDVVGHAQVKLSPDDHTILLHLKDHPDVPIIIANHEAAADAISHGTPVIDSHMSYQPTHDQVAAAVARHLDAAHTVHSWIPEAAGLVIGVLALRKLARGEDRGAVWTWTKSELGTAGAASTAATFASIVTGHELVRMPAAMGTRFFLSRADVAADSASAARTVRHHLEALREL